MNKKFYMMLFLSLPVMGGILLSGCYTEFANNNQNTREEYTDNQEYNVSELNANGEWINTPEYGRVWKPYVDSNWQPYQNGHWTYDGYNWIWVTDEPYGWVVYHYGYWTYNNYEGWIWIPSDNEWSPARVKWIQYGDYIAWAPLPYKNEQLPDPWSVNNRQWVAVRVENFNRGNINQYRYRDRIEQTSIDKSRVVRTQPNVTTIERVTNRTVPVYKIDRSSVNTNRSSGAVKGKTIEKFRVRSNETKNTTPRSPRAVPATPGNVTRPSNGTSTPANGTPVTKERQQTDRQTPTKQDGNQQQQPTKDRQRVNTDSRQNSDSPKERTMERNRNEQPRDTQDKDRQR